MSISFVRRREAPQENASALMGWGGSRLSDDLREAEVANRRYSPPTTSEPSMRGGTARCTETRGKSFPCRSPAGFSLGRKVTGDVQDQLRDPRRIRIDRAVVA